MKRGLKLGTAAAEGLAVTVETHAPMKRGLKRPLIAPPPVTTLAVETHAPMKRGLKQMVFFAAS